MFGSLFAYDITTSFNSYSLKNVASQTPQYNNYAIIEVFSQSCFTKYENYEL